MHKKHHIILTAVLALTIGLFLVVLGLTGINVIKWF